MPVTKQQAQTLAPLIAACRPYGATHWDTPGIYAAIGRVSDRALVEVIRAFTRGAEDRTAATPAVVVTNRDYWTEHSTERPTFTGVRHATDGCSICSLAEDACRRVPVAISGHEYEPSERHQPVAASDR